MYNGDIPFYLTVGMTNKVCRKCGSSSIPPNRIRNYDYICNKCWDGKYKSATKEAARKAKADAKKRMSKKGLPFDETSYLAFQKTKEYLEVCPICDRNVKEHSLTLTIDRIDCSQGYVSGNMQIMCWQCNNIKSTNKRDFWETLPSDYIERLKRASV